MTDITFAPLDPNDFSSTVTMKDGTEHKVLRTPASTFHQINQAKTHKHPEVALETLDREKITIDPKKVVAVK